jgi:hypothetical protein
MQEAISFIHNNILFFPVRFQRVELRKPKMKLKVFQWRRKEQIARVRLYC